MHIEIRDIFIYLYNTSSYGSINVCCSLEMGILTDKSLHVVFAWVGHNTVGIYMGRS